ncbi:MAG: N-6 DNA methylase [Gemmatimonadetes bacterium]|nr:N-6 DNA methylase [Gemmatimonadota bacterium]
MLDTETRRRIDTARDILVGKVPDPKSQVEQITIALIYKFMDDMDAKAEEFGGERQFFAGEFAQYSWASLMHSGQSGHEVLDLYATAIVRMPENPGIPSLFRDIFSNAYLPYRDPEILRAFLKVIDEFNYDHSERLGDAFEYLLSVLGSQGDAGQFRTPRHIIDFIVEIIDPKKNETVLDPACGTAGFLISSWKHIENAETDEKGNSTFTPDDKGRLAQNFTGYDISPDMVRLSLVNMYLHGFAQPRIHEYDTLTSEDKWNEYADVILANPPFMSPKGGIRPHNRFSVKSKRSEVLFVDYMAEHLTPKGRAGIIVPEGIIFQSQNAHRKLRRKLVEDYLVAVVSLPAGVFNPYSGVKTSILILDRALAKKTDHIVFLKVENDGFDLGAQRRETDQNDLPLVRKVLGRFLAQVRASGPAKGLESISFSRVAERGTDYAKRSEQSKLGLLIKKEEIAAEGEFSLSGERYRSSKTGSTKHNWITLGDITIGKPEYGSGARKVQYDKEVRYIRITDIAEDGRLKSDEFVSPSKIEPELFLSHGDLLIARSGSVGRTYIHEDIPGKYQFAGYLIRFRIDPAKAIPEYVYHITKSVHWREWIRSNSKTGTLTNINAKQYATFRFPLPSLKEQQEIVEEIKRYQRTIEANRELVKRIEEKSFSVIERVWTSR